MPTLAVRKFEPVGIFLVATLAIFLFPYSAMAEGIEMRITHSETDTANVNPSVSGNKIVWKNLGGRGIALFNLETGTQTQFRREHNSSESYNSPLISGENIVWTDNRTGKYQVYLYNLSTEIETQISSGDSDKYGLTMSGDKVAWSDYVLGTDGRTRTDIYVYDLTVHLEIRVTTSGYANHPSVFGNKIVWDERRDLGWWTTNTDIFMYDLDSHVETRVTNDSTDQYLPAISGDKIVWFDTNWRLGDFSNLYAYDLATNSGAYIHTNLGRTEVLSISGNKVVWSDDRDSDWKYDIRMYDFLTQTETPITLNPANQIQPSISGNKIVWSDYRNLNSNGGNRWDIYLYDLNPNVEPMAEISPVSVATLGQSVTFDGSGSSDVDGIITGYAWDFGDGNTGNGVTASHAYGVAGTYQVTLTVTDDDGATDTATTTVVVNAPPVATIALVAEVALGQVSSFDGSGSADADGTIASYNWDFGDGNTGAGVTTTHAYAQAGTYTATLTVTDNDGATDDAVVSVTIDALPEAVILPVATVLIGEVTSFDGSDSNDSDGNIVSYAWNFGDSATGSGETTTHTYASAGNYLVTLTVADDFGNTDSVTATAVVQTPAQAINDLMDLVESMNLAQGISNSLDSKLGNAADALNAMNAGSTNSAVSKLQAFINSCQAQSGNQLTVEQANQLIAAANRIIAALTN